MKKREKIPPQELSKEILLEALNNDDVELSNAAAEYIAADILNSDSPLLSLNDEQIQEKTPLIYAVLIQKLKKSTAKEDEEKVQRFIRICETRLPDDIYAFACVVVLSTAPDFRDEAIRILRNNCIKGDMKQCEILLFAISQNPLLLDLASKQFKANSKYCFEAAIVPSVFVSAFKYSFQKTYKLFKAYTLSYPKLNLADWIKGIPLDNFTPAQRRKIYKIYYKAFWKKVPRIYTDSACLQLISLIDLFEQPERLTMYRKFFTQIPTNVYCGNFIIGYFENIDVTNCDLQKELRIISQTLEAEFAPYIYESFCEKMLVPLHEQKQDQKLQLCISWLENEITKRPYYTHKVLYYLFLYFPPEQIQKLFKPHDSEYLRVWANAIAYSFVYWFKETPDTVLGSIRKIFSAISKTDCADFEQYLLRALKELHFPRTLPHLASVLKNEFYSATGIKSEDSPELLDELYQEYEQEVAKQNWKLKTLKLLKG